MGQATSRRKILAESNEFVMLLSLRSHLKDTNLFTEGDIAECVSAFFVLSGQVAERLKMNLREGSVKQAGLQ